MTHPAIPRLEMTPRLLADAGLGPGQRVLDIGCGHGDVAFLAAALVGPSGHVIGIDHDAAAITAARARAVPQTSARIDFSIGDILAPPVPAASFDAVVARRVLMYQPDPVAAVRALATLLKPGGIVVFQEHDGSLRGGPSLPLHEKVREWIWTTVEREGARRTMGFDLAAVLSEAGLVVEHVRAEAVVQTPLQDHPTAEIVRAMLPRIVRHGVATEEEIEVATLGDRLRAERRAFFATYVGELVFGAWARKAR